MVNPIRVLGELICCSCGKTTPKNAPNQRRCLSCANKSYKPVYNANIKKKCPVCNLFFHAIHGTQVYCSDTCRKDETTRKLNEKWIVGKKEMGCKTRVWGESKI